MELRFGVKESSMQMHLAINVRISEELGGEVLWEVAHDSKLELAGDFSQQKPEQRPANAKPNNQRTLNRRTAQEQLLGCLGLAEPKPCTLNFKLRIQTTPKLQKRYSST